MVTVDLTGYVCLFVFGVDQSPRKREGKVALSTIASPVYMSEMSDRS